MKAKILIGLTLATLACVPIAALGQEKKGKAFPRINVFSPMVYGVEPNIEVILNYTDEQKEKLGKAFQETMLTPALVALQPKKGEPLDKDKVAKFKEEATKAQAEFKKRVDEILTAEQKATIQKVDDALKNALANALTPEQKEKLESVKKPKKGK